MQRSCRSSLSYPDCWIAAFKRCVGPIDSQFFPMLDSKPMSSESPVRAVVVVFLLALALHVAYFALDGNSIANDTRKYVLPAESLLAGHGYARDGQPETERTPGYPLVLAALRGMGLDLRQIALLQHIASAAAAAALVLIARWMTGNTFIGIVSGVVTAIDLPTIYHANMILTETLCAILGLALFALIWRIARGSGQAAAAGLLLGAITLVRPVAMLFFIPLALYLAWMRRDAARRIVPLFVICALLLPAAWFIRNDLVSGVPTLSTNEAVLMLYFHAAGTLAIGDAGDFTENLERRQKELRVLADARVRSEMGIRDVNAIPYVQRAASDFRLGREIVLAHPFAFTRLFVRGVAINFLGGSAEALTRITTLTRSAANKLLLAYTGVAFVLAIIGQLWLLRTNRPLGVLILITVGYFIAFTAGALAYSRFRVPVVPMYAMAIAAGVHVLRERWRSIAATGATRTP